MIVARTASDAEIRHVLSCQSDERKRELTATAWHDSVAQLATEIAMVRGVRPGAPVFALFRASMVASTVPCAIVGVLPYGPGWGGMIWAATPHWPAIALGSHRWWRQFFVPEVLGRFRRVEFTALETDHASRRWLAGLGFTEEGVAYRQGKRGEDFVHFAWVNPDHTVGIAHA